MFETQTNYYNACYHNRLQTGFNKWQIYPTAIPSSDPQAKITGELHRVTTKDLAMLDIYEGCPEAFYERVTVDSVITTESGKQLHITAFMYVKGHALEGV